MSNEPDGNDNLEVIRKLLQKLEEAAASDTTRSSEPKPLVEQAVAPKAEAPILKAQPIVVAKDGDAKDDTRELATLQRTQLPMRLEPNQLPQKAGPSTELTTRDDFPPRRKQSPVLAITAFALGAVTAGAVVAYLEPIKRLILAPQQSTASRPAEVATAQEKAPEPQAAQPAAPREAAAESTPVRPADSATDVPKPSTADAAKAPEPAPPVRAESGPTKTAEATPAPAAQPATPSAQKAPASQSQQQTPASQPAASAAAAAPVTLEAVAKPASEAIAKPATPPQQPTLSIPQQVAARAGAQTAFPLKLEPMPKEGDSLLVVLRGMPEWAALSKGSALGNEIWLIPAHTATDLELDVTSGRDAKADIKVELATLDGRVLARESTTLAAARTPALTARAPAPDRVEGDSIVRILARADLMLDTGDIAAARELYKAAAEAGSAGGALKLGETYDPSELIRLGMAASAADEAVARRWYELAASLGSPQATDRLTALKKR